MTEDQLIAGLCAWVEIESPTHHVPGVDAMMDLVAADAEAAGVAAERIGGRDGLADSLILRAGPVRAEGSVLVLSHLDTVHPVGTIERDLMLRREGDRLYGPGIYDMKGGAYLAFRAFLAAAKAREATRPLVFLFTPDEEIGSPTSRDLIEAEGRRAAVALVTEPARDGGRCVTARKGVGRFSVEIEGRPSHAGSRHQDGRSAIREAAHQILAIEGMTDYARGVTTSVGMLSGGTAVNVIPQHCRFEADLRVVTAADGEEYERRILGLRPVGGDVTVRVEGGMNRPPYERSEAIGALLRRAQEIAAELGQSLEETVRTGGGSDGNFTAALGTPTLDGLGVDGDGAHTLHEHALVSCLLPRLALMERLLTRLP